MGSRRSSDFSADTFSKVESISLEYDDYPLDLVGMASVRREVDSFTSDYRLPNPTRDLPIVNRYMPSPPTDLPLRNTFQLIDCRKDVPYDYSTPGSKEAWSRRHSLIKPNHCNANNYSFEHHNYTSKKDKSLCKNCCHVICKPCLRKYNPLPENPSFWNSLRYSLLCPPHGKIAKYVTLTLSAGLVYGVIWAITGQQALPGGNFFALVVLVIAGYIGGLLVEKVKLPALLGMLITGCLLRNVPIINVGKDIDSHWSSALRNVALCVILLRAGIGLDPVVLKKLSFAVLRLAFLPCIFEAIAVAVACHLLLGFPWLWGFMMGFVLGAVTPAVVVPSMLTLHLRGYGTNSGIATLVIAASSVDDVLAISVFTVLLGVVFSNGNLVWSIVQGPLEAVGGILYGIILGMIMWYIPDRNNSNASLFRFIILFASGLFAMFGSRAACYPGAGPLGCLVVAFVAALRWRKDGWKDEDNPVGNTLDNLWLLCEPLMFVLIGAEIDISKIKGTTIGLGIAVIFLGIACRMLVSFCVIFGAGLSLREKLFVTLAWLPKATVQAAIGTVALDTARSKDASDEQIELGIKIVTIAVLSIVLMAPIGAAAISIAGPRLLEKSTDHEEESHLAGGERLELTWDDPNDFDTSDLAKKMADMENTREVTTERETVT